jgi:hypothetical protein
MLIRKWSTEIVVTSRRIIYKRGLISRRAEELSLGKIEEINLVQSILGRIFGSGRLRLSGTGVGAIALPDVDNPLALRRAIESAKIKLSYDPELRPMFPRFSVFFTQPLATYLLSLLSLDSPRRNET